MSESTTKKKNRKKVIVIIVLAIILAILLTLIFAYSESGVSQSTDTPESTPMILNDNRVGIEGTYQYKTREEILAELQESQQMVTDKVSSNVTFSTGRTGATGQWIMENTIDNTVIQQAEIYLEDLLIAKTEPIYPGQYIQTVELLNDVEPGEHKALVYISYYNVDNKVFAGQVGYQVNLSVKE